MFQNQFDEIMMVLHFNDTNFMKDKNSPLYKSCQKIQPLLDHFWKVFKTSVNSETHMSIDKQVVPFKGKHNLKRYFPKKQKNWGINCGLVQTY